MCRALITTGKSVGFSRYTSTARARKSRRNAGVGPHMLAATAAACSPGRVRMMTLGGAVGGCGVRTVTGPETYYKLDNPVSGTLTVRVTPAGGAGG